MYILDLSSSNHKEENSELLTCRLRAQLRIEGIQNYNTGIIDLGHTQQYSRNVQQTPIVLTLLMNTLCATLKEFDKGF